MVIIKNIYIYIDKQVKNLINILCVQLNLYFHLINFLIFFLADLVHFVRKQDYDFVALKEFYWRK